MIRLVRWTLEDDRPRLPRHQLRPLGHAVQHRANHPRALHGLRGSGEFQIFSFPLSIYLIYFTSIFSKKKPLKQIARGFKSKDK